MGYKCAPQLKGLTIGEPPVKTREKDGKEYKYKNRHRANGLAIAKEMLGERASRSKTLDRSRSHLNTYEGYATGEECWAAVLDDVEAHRMPVKLKNGKTAYRRIPANIKAELVPAWSVIIKPPPEMTVDWTESDFDRFDDDSMSVLAAIHPMFRRSNRKAKAIHRDEGRMMPVLPRCTHDRHTHELGDALDEEGRYCGNLIRGELYDQINRQYPAMMRDLGWDLDDLDVTDWARMEKDENGEYVDPDYVAERKEKRKLNGRDVNQVIADELADTKQQLLDKKQEVAKIEKQGLKDARLWNTGIELLQQQHTALQNEVNAKSETLKSLDSEIEDRMEFLAWKASKQAEEAARAAQVDENTIQPQEAARTSQEAPERETAAQVTRDDAVSWEDLMPDTPKPVSRPEPVKKPEPVDPSKDPWVTDFLAMANEKLSRYSSKAVKAMAMADETEEDAKKRKSKGRQLGD